MKKRDLWIIGILIALSLFSIYYFMFFDTSLQPVSLARIAPACITPPVYPQLIMQSATICPGTYNYGIGIGSNNLNIKCQPGTGFNGATWNGSNGLTILAKKNVTVEGCSFANFTGNGVYVLGNGTINSASNINLLKIKSSSNGASGVYLGSNIFNLTLNDSTIRSNKMDGITLTSKYFGAYSNASSLFPDWVWLSDNRITDNLGNGVNIEAFDYLAYVLPSGELINNTMIINRNNISNNLKDGIRNNGFFEGEGSSFSSYVARSYVVENEINYNGLSGISIIAQKNNSIINASGVSSAGFGYIVQNNIMGNKMNGIFLYSPKPRGFYPTINYYPDLKASKVFNNLIVFNKNYGVAYLSENTSSLSTFQIAQNAIKSNANGGVSIQGSSRDWVIADIACNDIIDNRVFGVKINNLGQMGGDIRTYNFIEKQLIGILIENQSSFPSLITRNYLKDNVRAGILLNVTSSFFGNQQIEYNDFMNNTPQAYDSAPNTFQYNYWNDYSPNCADINPADGWCDVPRPIPLASQDVQPKAGLSWNNSARGYFVAGSTGIITKSICPQVILPPSILS